MYNTNLSLDESFKIAFTIGNVNIYWYAIFSILGYAVAIAIFLFTLWKRYKVSVDVGFYYIFFALPMILLGARTWSFLIGDASGNFFNFREGGLAIEGGVIFGVLTALIYFPIILRFPKYHKRVVVDGKVYIQKPSMWIFADAIIPTILIGQAIGRWGNFFNGEIYGNEISESNLLWLKNLMPGVFNHMQADHDAYTSTGQLVIENGKYYAPLFLYESVLNTISFIIIYGILAEIKQIKIGVISGMYCISYGIIRLIMESQRAAPFKYLGNFVTTGLLLGVGILMVIYCQFIFNKLRNYNWYLFFKNWILSIIYKNKYEKVKSINEQTYIRKGSDELYYAYR